jgi:GAF domain-containing protein
MADQMADVAELEQQIAQKDREIAELRQRLSDEVGLRRQLIQVSTHLNSTPHLDDLLRLVITAATELLSSEGCALMLVDEETGELEFNIVAGERATEVVKHRVPAGHGIVGWVVQNAQPVIVNDPRQDPRFYAEIDRSLGNVTRNVLAVPLRVKDQIIGAIELINNTKGAFDQKDLELAEALASQSAIAIDNAIMYARLADAVVTSRMSYRL